jgi:dimethylargininase
MVGSALGRRPSIDSAAVASLVALTRAVSPAIARCELTHVAREPIDVARATAQHATYEAALADLGCRVEQLPSDETMPDAVFIEDTAIVLDELAIVTRPGAVSRRRETAAVARALGRYRPLVTLEPPATLDGGDVIVLGRTIYIGVSTRTNVESLAAVDGLLAPHGYDVRRVTVRGCLHLKSAATAVGRRAVLVDPAWVFPDVFEDCDRVEIAEGERGAANVLAVNGTLLSAEAFPRTRDLLERRGYRVRSVDLSELAKAEGAVTCCSLIVPEGDRAGRV